MRSIPVYVWKGKVLFAPLLGSEVMVRKLFNFLQSRLVFNFVSSKYSGKAAFSGQNSRVSVIFSAPCSGFSSSWGSKKKYRDVNLKYQTHIMLTPEMEAILEPLRRNVQEQVRVLCEVNGEILGLDVLLSILSGI